ncbi:MAG: FG-GAP repeat domain-containing protein [Pirellulaceae bacterium]
MLPSLLKRKIGVALLTAIWTTQAVSTAESEEPIGSRFTYLDEREPYYVGLHFPKFTTPMWIGEDGVDAVFILSIDDMGRTPATVRYTKPPADYERFLRPILERLKQIDGRAPVSIFTCEADLDDPRLQKLLREGLSMEVHTTRHPVPLFQADEETRSDPGPPETVIRNVLDSLANVSRIPGNKPVAFRMPGCDARNTVSPRFYTEVFPRLTEDGRFLLADSSVFMFYTKQDATLQREWLIDSQGRDRFEKYLHAIPWCKHYANCIFNYPYPYVIDRTIWEFPVLVPGDAHGVHVHKAKSPLTVADWKAALDATVYKKGVMTICFHPHGYIRSDQLVELVDYADRKYGKRVKFLNYQEAYGRIVKHALGGAPLRSGTGGDNGVRLLDVNADGYLDVVIGNSQRRETRIWRSATGQWETVSFPVVLVRVEGKRGVRHTGAHFFTAAKDGHAGVAVATDTESGVWHFVGRQWQPSSTAFPSQVAGTPLRSSIDGIDRGIRFRDLDGDGLSDLMVNNESQNAVFFANGDRHAWRPAPFALPGKGCLVDARGADQGLRFVDLDEDGDDDLVFSNDREYWVRLYEGPAKGWSITASQGKAGSPGALPPIVRQGTLNGVWFHSRAMVLANEFTFRKPDLIERRPFQDLLSK